MDNPLEAPPQPRRVPAYAPRTPSVGLSVKQPTLAARRPSTATQAIAGETPRPRPRRAAGVPTG